MVVLSCSSLSWADRLASQAAHGGVAEHWAALRSALRRDGYGPSSVQASGAGGSLCPRLFAFLSILAILAGLVCGGMFALATFVEPEPREMSATIPTLAGLRRAR